MNKKILVGLEPKLADALDELISLFDINTMRWFARLYDPEAGAFYYSNSGRDYEGFGPDLESTVQGLRCVESRGMLENYGGSLKNALPKDIVDKLVGFTKKCADPDGYYYHPQWGKDITVSRRGRDLTWAMQIYDWFGEKPPYSTAVDMLSSGAKNESKTLPEHLKSREAFINYLDSLDFKNKSYSAGNLLNAQTPEIRAAGLTETCAEYLTACQNSKNGLFEEEISYSSVSGLMKVSGFFSSAGIRIPNFEKAIDSCIEATLSSQPADAVVYVYNPHSAVATLVGAMEKIGDSDAVAFAKKRYKDNIIPLINKTHDKLLVFRKPDGSFSYSPNRSACKSQGAPVAIYMENEGDVNATTIAMSGGVGMLLHNLGIPFKIYDNSDYTEFISVLMAQTPIMKKPVPEGRESSPGRF
ncbi:MAG: hypothetical protein J6B48_10095 [Clostridia bacterium]|nr:hypothetical protein [Clostridia bacterium]